MFLKVYLNQMSYKFFQNVDCEFFPCHKTDDKENFNCLFCYCPVYFTECNGNYSLLDNGIKDCSNCLIPHCKNSWEIIQNKLQKEFSKVSDNKIVKTKS